MDLSQFKQKFIIEAGDLLTSLDNLLIELEKAPTNKSLIDEAFRIMHTIKGTSGMYGFEKIVEVTHEIETLYDLVRSQQMQVTPVLIEITFAAADHIRDLLNEKESEETFAKHLKLMGNINSLKASIEPEAPGKIVNPKENTNSSKSTWNILFYPNEDIIKRCINLVYTFQDLFNLGTYQIHSSPYSQSGTEVWSIFLITDKPVDDIESALLFVSDYCKILKIADFNIFEPTEIERRDEELKSAEKVIVKSVDPLPQRSKRKVSEITREVLESLSETKDSGIKQSTFTSSNRIYVDTQKLDLLMYLVSELVTTKSELLLALVRQNEDKAMDAAEKIEKLSKLFSNNALDIRLVSLHEMINRFKRLVRDLAKQLDKNIDFVTVGEDTELDKSIIDIIGEPIMHLIRNCIDHGIESSEKRLERNKSEVGIIRFEANKAGNYVYITISDDGNGIDPDYIYRKAVEKGFINAGTQLSGKEIFNLIFLPGFSTAQALSEVSGRGVGMDIVLKKIQEIRGEITIDSTKEKGTSFTIKIQQTISIIDTLLISSAGTTYAIPVEDIEACELEADEKMISQQSHLIVYNDQLIPYLNLRTSFAEGKPMPEKEKIVIINRQNKCYAIVADNIIGEYQAVIKPLGKTFSNIKFLSGASILGDGSIALLLDTDKLRLEIASTSENMNLN